MSQSQNSAEATTRGLDKLQNIEQEISKMLGLAADAVKELSKDKPSGDIVEYKTKDFIKTLEGIEKGISDEIHYLSQVSTSQAHQGSVYGPEKDYELSLLQTLLAKDRLKKYKSAIGDSVQVQDNTSRDDHNTSIIFRS